MHIPEFQLAKLHAFGYTEVEARFLGIVATHSGYFTMGQFLSFANASSGRRSARFAQKLLTLRHASVQRYRHNGGVYHLDRPQIYAAIGKDYLRRRREHELHFIRTRLLTLDFVLAHAEVEYFETAEAKKRYFIEGCKIDSQLFSPTDGNTNAITFGDGFPLCIASAPGYEPAVSFIYVDPGHQSMDPYIAHLRRYRSLFRQLPRLQFFYVATKWGRHQEAAVLFSMLVQGEGLADLIRMFEVENRWDNKQYDSLTEADLIFRLEARKRFRGQAFETLRRLWRRNQLPKDFQPQEKLFTPKREILFQAIEVPGQEGIFGETAKRWSESWQGLPTGTSSGGGPAPIAVEKSLHQG